MTATLAGRASPPMESYAVSRLAETGDVVEAARAARALLDDGCDDFRLRTYVWLGAFVDQGFAPLPDALRAAAEHLKALSRSAAVSPKTCERALTWMFRTLSTRIAFHQTLRDATWQRWLTTPAETLEQALTAAAELREALELSGAGPALAAVAGIERALREDIAPRLAAPAPPDEHDEVATAGTRPAAAEADRRSEIAREAPREESSEPHGHEAWRGDEDDDGDEDDGGSASGDESDEPSEDGLRPLDACASPHLLALARKLEAFAALIEAERFEKAGVLARELDGEIANFDLLRYFPGLFAPYYRALHRHGVELSSYLEPPRTASERALEQYCRLDLEGFVADD